jgi:WD40 repeat protein
LFGPTSVWCGLSSLSARQANVAATSNRLVTVGEDNVAFWEWGAWGLGKAIERTEVMGLPTEASDTRSGSPSAAVFFGEQEKFVLTSSHEATLTIWNLEHPEKSKVLVPGQKPLLAGTEAEPTALALHGTLAALLVSNMVSFWPITNDEARQINPTLHTPAGIEQLEFRNQGTQLVGLSSNWIHILDIKTQTWADRPLSNDQEAEHVSLSADGNTAAVASNESVSVMDVETGRMLFRQKFEPYHVRTITLSDRGNLLAIDRSTSTEIWDIHRKVLIKTIEDGGVAWIIRHVQFSPDDRYITVWQPDYRTALWDITTGQEYVVFGNPELCCASRWIFDDLGKRLAEVGANGVTTWDTDIEAWQRNACRIANRDFLGQEVNQYFGVNKKPHACR